jgi:hypothetical protein
VVLKGSYRVAHSDLSTANSNSAAIGSNQSIDWTGTMLCLLPAFYYSSNAIATDEWIMVGAAHDEREAKTHIHYVLNYNLSAKNDRVRRSLHGGEKQ